MSREVIIELLRQKAVAVTAARLFVMGLMIKNQGLISLRKVRKLCEGHVDRVTLYRTLKFFCEVGLIYKIYGPDNKPSYALESTSHKEIKEASTKGSEYYHFKCKVCEKVICLPEAFEGVQLPPGYIKTEVNLLISGYCVSCSEYASLATSGKKTADKMFKLYK